MLGRDFFVINRWQKLLSLVLATLIWLAVRTGVSLNSPSEVGHGVRQFDRLPLTVLTTSTDLGRYRLEPEHVTIILRGDTGVLDKVAPAEIEAFVNLAENAPLGTRGIHVYPPSGTELVSVRPKEVLVERIPASEPAPGGK